MCDNSLSLNFFFIGEKASLRLSTCVKSDSMNSYEIHAEKDSRFDSGFLKYKGTFAYYNQSAIAEENSRISSASFWGGSGFAEMETELKGVGSSALHIGLASSGDHEKISLNTLKIRLKPYFDLPYFR